MVSPTRRTNTTRFTRPGMQAGWRYADGLSVCPLVLSTRSFASSWEKVGHELKMMEPTHTMKETDSMEDIVLAAARIGHIQVLDWGCSNGCVSLLEKLFGMQLGMVMWR
jgi:hypothetical protein